MYVNPWNGLSLSRVWLNSSPLPGVLNICVFRWELCGRSKCHTFSRLLFFFLPKCYPYPVVMRQCTSTEASHVTELSMTLLAFVVTITLHVLWSVLYLGKTLQYWFICTFPGLACHRSFNFCFGWSLTVPDMKDSSEVLKCSGRCAWFTPTIALNFHLVLLKWTANLLSKRKPDKATPHDTTPLPHSTQVVLCLCIDMYCRLRGPLKHFFFMSFCPWAVVI
jgi:hypothetical protein